MNDTDLRNVLADPAQSGAYFVEEDDSAAMAEAGEALDYHVYRIDLTGCPDKVELMERLAAAMRLPTWFGGTWDALADVLGDLSWQPAVGYLLLIEHASDLRDASPEDFDTLLEILNEAAFRWAEDDRPFWAILPMPAGALPDDEGEDD
ncbi:barstar family protein [Lysobacter olei]